MKIIHDSFTTNYGTAERFVKNEDGPTILVIHHAHGRPDFDPFGHGQRRNPFVETWQAVLQWSDVGSLIVIKTTATWPERVLRDAIKEAGWTRPSGVLLAGPKACAMAEGIPSGVDPTHAFFHLWKWNGYPAVATYDPLTLVETHDGAALLGHIVRSLDILVTGDDKRIDDSLPVVNVIDTVKKFDEFLPRLEQAKYVGFDTETAGLARVGNTVLTMQFAFKVDSELRAYFLPWRHPETPWTADQLAYIRKQLKRYFQTSDSVHIGANLGFDVAVTTSALGLKYYAPRLWDIQGAEYALDENRKFRRNVRGHPVPGYSLAQISTEYGGFGYLDSEIGKADRARMIEIPLKNIIKYGALDVVYPYRIRERQLDRIKDAGPSHKGVAKFIVNQISATIHAFATMELNGMLIDKEYLLKESGNGKLREIIDKAKAELEASPEVRKAARYLAKEKLGSDRGLFGAVNFRFDIGKPDHAQALFVEVLGLEPADPNDGKARRKDGRYKLDKKFKAHNKDNPLMAAYIAFGEAIKLHSTYVMGFLKTLSSDKDMADGKLRPRFEYLPVVTGRASARKPSLHQIPSRSGLAKVIKRQFIAAPGYLLIEMDYNAHEVKNWAIAAGDKALASAFLYGAEKRVEYRLLKRLTDADRKHWEIEFLRADLHRQNCKRFFKVAPEDATKEQRNAVKSVVFGTIYDLHTSTLATNLGISEVDAEKMVDDMFDAFPDGKAFIDRMHDGVKDDLQVVNPIGQVRHLWMALSPNEYTQRKGSRKGPNSAIQSVSSEEGFQGHRNLHKLIWEFERRKLEIGLSPVNSVHDSAYAYNKISSLPIGLYLMEHAFTTLVHAEYERLYGVEFIAPLEVEFKISGALSEGKEWDFRYDSLPEQVEAACKWQKDELKYTIPTEELRKMEHNLEIIRKLRRRELLRWTPDAAPNTIELDLRNLKDYDWRL